jgi:hypothetical protein
MTVTDYSVINMPSMMSRNVLVQDPNNPDNWVRDEAWYEATRATYAALLDFFKSNNLLKVDVETPRIDDVVLKLSDLNEEGQQLVKSGADDRWLASFDRPGSTKSPSDVSALEKALQRLRAAGRN